MSEKIKVVKNFISMRYFKKFNTREKLEKYKTEVKLRDQSEVKSEIKNKTPKDKTR